MTSLPSNPEIVIVGAGAAGVGAGLALTRLGIPFVILEAKARIGGRAYSEATSLGAQWDQGAHWFHAAERNPLRVLAERIGHPFLPREETWARQWYVEGRALSAAEQAAGGDIVEAAMEASDAAGDAGRDISQAAAAGGLAEPYGPFARFVFEAIGSGPADDMSALDVARYDGGETDFPVTGGYGRLIERLGEPLPIRLACPVEAITAAPGGLEVATSAGTLRARAVIVTVSDNVLLAGHIKFHPALPLDLVRSLEGLPCGDCEKIGVALASGTLPGFVDDKLLARHDGDVYSVQIRPYGREIVTAYLAGQHARRLSAAGDAEAGTLLGDVLAGIFGSDVRKGLGRAVVTGWSRDPHCLGAYSYARAGMAAARPALIAADLSPLFLAGEAHLLDWYSTAHGAHVSGGRAAHKAARHLGHEVSDTDPLWLPTAMIRPSPAAR